MPPLSQPASRPGRAGGRIGQRQTAHVTPSAGSQRTFSHKLEFTELAACNSLVALILPSYANPRTNGVRTRFVCSSEGSPSGCPPLPSRPVNGARIRTVAAIAGRVLLGILAALLLGATV